MTKNFTLEEFLESAYARRHNIKEQFTPPQEVKDNLKLLCINTLQPLADLTKRSVNITSGYRCTRVNKGIGGSPQSDHILGRAADINIKGITSKELFDFIIKSKIPFDQLIEEFGAWVHISFRGKENRNQKLIATKNGKKTVYTQIP